LQVFAADRPFKGFGHYFIKEMSEQFVLWLAESSAAVAAGGLAKTAKPPAANSDALSSKIVDIVSLPFDLA
jgi:hypothetical protein